MGLRKIMIILCGILFSGCASTSYLSDNIESAISGMEKKNIRIYLTTNKSSVIHATVVEAFSKVFRVVSTPPYDVKIVTSVPSYDVTTIKEKCSGSRSEYKCEGTYNVKIISKIDFYDTKDTLIYSETYPESKLVNQYSLALNKDTAKNRLASYVAGEANFFISNQVAEKSLRNFHNRPEIAELEKQAIVSQEKAASNLFNPDQKLPISCFIEYPPNLDTLKASAPFDRHLLVNSEKQGAMAEFSFGGKFSEKFQQIMERRFASVSKRSATLDSQGQVYNPQALSMYMEVEFDQPTIDTAQNIVTIPGRVFLKSPGGGKFKTIDITSNGAIQIKSGGGKFLSEVVSGVSLLRFPFSGTIVNQALENGCEDAIDQAVQKVAVILQPSLAKEFAEFAGYDAAKNSKSVADMRSFLTLYPNSIYCLEVKEMLDDVSYAAAVNSGSLELFVDYLRSLPSGKHVADARYAALDILANQIRLGNMDFCILYCQLAQGGSKNVVSRDVACDCR